ncbi:MAG: FkbM family methyltransferase [Christensenellaceae bacterium]|jgi:FkbM family methyltransferase
MAKLDIKEKKSLWDYLKTVKKPVVLYGMGNGAEKIHKELDRIGVRVDGVFASDEFVRDQYFYDHKVITYSEAKKRFPDMVVLTAFGSHRDEVVSRIYGIAEEYELYAPDVPVYGDTLFDVEFYWKHEKELNSVYAMLEDDMSKQVFCDILNYKISGKLCYLRSSESSPEEAMQAVLKLADDETYMDVGAYNGDTIQEFLEYVSGYRYIYAIEPDKKNFDKLLKNTGHLQCIEHIHTGVSKPGETTGTMTGSGRGAVRSNAAEKAKAEFDTIDNILHGREATYIKYDIEGREKEAIAGAQNTILRYKPKMLVSAYHRSEDVFTLPLAVMEIRNDYKLYFRRYPCIPAWDMNYYFV